MWSAGWVGGRDGWGGHGWMDGMDTGGWLGGWVEE
jgi:hypothetical protein